MKIGRVAPNLVVGGLTPDEDETSSPRSTSHLQVVASQMDTGSSGGNSYSESEYDDDGAGDAALLAELDGELSGKTPEVTSNPEAEPIEMSEETVAADDTDLSAFIPETLDQMGYSVEEVAEISEIRRQLRAKKALEQYQRDQLKERHKGNRKMVRYLETVRIALHSYDQVKEAGQMENEKGLALKVRR